MTDDKVNKIIAEFIGWTERPDHIYVNENEMYYEKEGISFVAKRFTKSLDALVPVWEKLNDDRRSYYFDYIGILNMQEYNEVFFGEVEDHDRDSQYHLEKDRSTVYQAAAHATAKAILALQEKK